MTRALRCLSIAAFAVSALVVSACERKGGPVSVSRVDPESGSTAGGDQISIIGTGFEPGQTTAEVRFGRKRAEGVVIASSTQIHVNTPPSDRGPVDITVILNDGKAFTIPEGFRFVAPQDPSRVREAYLQDKK